MPPSRFDTTELPVLAPRTHCVLIPRDPNSIYVYWDYTQEDINGARNQLKFESEDAELILRVYDITLIKFNRSNANHSWDLKVSFLIKNLYINVMQDDADYCVELGIYGREGHFIPLTRSNMVRTPPKSVSKRDDLIWQDINVHRGSKPHIKENIKKKFQTAKDPRTYYLTDRDIRAYYMKFFSEESKKGKGKMPSLEDILKRKLRGKSWAKVQPFITSPQRTHPGASGEFIEKEGASENLVSLSLQGGASEGRLKKKEFFFEIWTELIVYGRTEPDATVWLNEKGIKLNPDGTFSLRYALADGEIPFKFIAQSSDAVQQRHINTGVQRERTVSFPKMLKDPHG